MSGFVMFEVLSQPVVPGIPNVPYVEQGSFIQIANTSGAPANVQIRYFPAQPFVPSSGAVKLFANYIDNNGQVTMIPPAQFAQQNGFPAVQIPSYKTFIFGVQYVILATQSQSLIGGTPQDGVATRGFATVFSNVSSLIPPLSTIRQVFTNYNGSGQAESVNSSAYSVPFQLATSAEIAALEHNGQKILTPA
jgi:hypothetical protein